MNMNIQKHQNFTQHNNFVVITHALTQTYSNRTEITFSYANRGLAGMSHDSYHNVHQCTWKQLITCKNQSWGGTYF